MLGRWIVCVAWLLTAVVPAVGAEFMAAVTGKAPVVDGRIDAAEWADAMGIDGLAWEGRLDRRRARVMVMATPTHIYAAIQSQLPAEGALLAAVDRDTEKLVFDDSVELWIDPTPGSERGAAYQLIANTLDRRYFAKHARGGEPAEMGWNGQWQVKSGQHEGWWHCEMAVLVESVAKGRKVTDGTWGINLCRNWKNPWSFSSLGGGAYAPKDEVVFRFAENVPVIQQRHEADPLGGGVRSILNVRSAQPASLKVVQRLRRDLMPDVLVEETVVLTAGEAKEVALKVEDQASKGMTLAMSVASVDGSNLYFGREAGWKTAQGPWAWKAKKVEKLPMDLQFAYYPYENTLRVMADVSGLPAGAKLEHLLVTVRAKGKPERTIHSMRMSGFDKNGRAAAEVSLPELEGEYEIAATAAGLDVPKGEVVRSFERRRYEWERNELGKSEKVYAPFEPLKLDWDAEDMPLHAVLREHRLDGTGLWRQVIAKSAHTGVAKPILASPMRYMRTIQGEPPEPVEGSINCITGGMRPYVHSRLDGMISLANWDVDGMAQYRLRVLPQEDPIDSLVLEIPFRDDAAPMMHAMSEGLRDSIVTQRIPAGQGVVWDASKLPVLDMPKNFCTYIYVGSAVRGICWFAENDAGWGWDASKPNVELVRQGDVLTLRVHLINKPTTITESREIRFGLQAAPVKPRLSPWRYRYYRDRYTLLGTDINWLALGDCGSVYPAGKDLFFWEMIKRGNRERLTEPQVREVIERGRKYFEPYGEEKVKSFIAHARHNLLSRFGQKMVYYYNRASYQAADEFQTFQDEWGLSDYRSVGPGKGIGEIKIVPSESYIDHALWWYGKSSDAGGNLGVYWDNWFIASSLNTKMTPAYAKPDGSVMPAAGMMGLRELCRRTFQFMNERGMTPIVMPHMTSTNILPLHGFATVQYDWEWKYSEGDVQDRFSREYLLLVSNGELAGTWPVLLGEHGKQGSDPWIQRTYAAVSIVHELDPRPSLAKVWKPLIDPIIALLDEPTLEVWRYWDERPRPVVANHSDLPTIVYSVPGKHAIAAVVSYADRDMDATLAIDPAALELGDAYRVVDVETGEELPAAGNRVSFKLKKHDIRELRLEGRK